MNRISSFQRIGSFKMTISGVNLHIKRIPCRIKFAEKSLQVNDDDNVTEILSFHSYNFSSFKIAVKTLKKNYKPKNVN